MATVDGDLRGRIIQSQSVERNSDSERSESGSRHSARVIRVGAFVDWNAQIHLSGLEAWRDPLMAAKTVLERTARRISQCLSSTEHLARFSVSLRLYHGWHRGFEPSQNKKAIKTVLAATDFTGLSSVPSVTFLPNVGYGDCLLSARPQRLHERLAIHLPNTLRTQNRADTEKMVDTAMATDVVFTAFTEPTDWILVVAEDDDLVPSAVHCGSCPELVGSTCITASFA